MALTYYAVRPVTLNGVTYAEGDAIATDDLGTAEFRLLRKGIITADGGVGIASIPEGLATPTNLLWDDVRVSLQRATTGASAPSLTTFRGGTQAYAFSPTTMNQLYFDVQLPHGYHVGSEIRPHIHWSPGSSTNTGGVRWGLEYAWANVNDDFPATTTLEVTQAAVGDYNHQIQAFGAIDGTGKRASSVLLCRVFRNATHVADTFTGNAFAVSLDFHFQMDAMGSAAEYPGA